MSRPGPDVRRAAARIVVALVAAAVASGGFGTSPVRAHTDVDFTLPADGAAVGEPVGEVRVGFTQPVTLIGPGFEVLDPQGNVLTPFVVTDDDRVFRLRLDPPLAGGEVAVRWEARAEDGHILTGGFSFTISVDSVTTTTTTTTTTTATTATTATTTTATTAPATRATATSLPVTTAVPTAPGIDAPASTVRGSDPPRETTVPVGHTSGPSSDGDAGGSSAVYIALAAAVVLGAATFVAIRWRVSTGP